MEGLAEVDCVGACEAITPSERQDSDNEKGIGDVEEVTVMSTKGTIAQERARVRDGKGGVDRGTPSRKPCVIVAIATSLERRP